MLSFCLIALTFLDLPLLNELRLKSFDVLLQHFAAPLAEPPVVIVDIDGRSLAEYGQWPWSRSRIAELIRNIAAAGPAVIGLDILFGEPDRTASNRLAAPQPAAPLLPLHNYFAQLHSWRSLSDPDEILAKTLRSSPVPVILGHLFTHHETISGSRSEDEQHVLPRRGSFALRGRDPAPFLHRFNRTDLNLPVLEKNAQGSGFFNIVPDDDAIFRRLPLLAALEQPPLPDLTAYPSLVLAMLQAASGRATIVVTSNENGVRTVQVGAHQIPVTRKGEMVVSFSKAFASAGSGTAAKHRLRYVSAADMLDPSFHPDQDPFRLKNAYVLVGTSALGLFDLISVPVSTVFPGVEFHGQALNTILSRSFLDRPDWLIGLEILQIACIGLLMTLLLPRTGAAAGGLLMLGIVGASFAFSLVNFWYCDLMTDLVTPPAAALLLFTSLTFFNYFAEEKKTQRLRAVFSQYLAPAVVEELIQNKDSVVFSGEERELTILFSDIRSFTSMAEKMRPESLCAFLNEYLTPMTAAVMDRRGTVDKFIGDAVMAFWNAPLTVPEHSKLACESALAMLKELDRLNHLWLKRGLPTLRIGIGLHSGVARVGNMGSKQRFEYTIIGDAVNLTSRLEGLTKLYGADILATDSIRASLHEAFLFRQVDMVRVAGKSEPVLVCELLGKRGQTRLTEKEVEDWHEAFALYNIGDFSCAETALHSLTMQQPEDKLYALYMQRCRQLAEHPPAHWDGITDMRTK